MLKVRIIPTLLVKNHGLVKGVGFDSWRRVGPVLPAIKVYNTRGVDELIVVDITATTDGVGPDIDGVADFSDECFVPLTVGGGIRTLDHIQGLLAAGADKVAVNTLLFEDPAVVRQAASRFGAQCIVASIDSKREGGDYQVYTRSGSHRTDETVATAAVRAQELGVGEILVTSIERDGSMEGYDIDLIHTVSSAVSIPVIASGGAGSYADLHTALSDGGATAVAAASIFHFTEQTPREAKSYLGERGLPVRVG